MEAEGRERAACLLEGTEGRLQAWLGGGEAEFGTEARAGGCLRSSLGCGFSPQSLASATKDQEENCLEARGPQGEGTAPVPCQDKGLSSRLSPVGTCRVHGLKEGVHRDLLEPSWNKRTGD